MTNYWSLYNPHYWTWPMIIIGLPLAGLAGVGLACLLDKLFTRGGNHDSWPDI